MLVTEAASELSHCLFKVGGAHGSPDKGGNLNDTWNEDILSVVCDALNNALDFIIP